MKVTELLKEDWTMTVNLLLKKIGSTAQVDGRTVTLKTKREGDALSALCKQNKIICPKIVIREDIVMEKRPAGAPKWHDSDAPDANGKFKELGIEALADWLIKTRGGNMQKINGSLQQQIIFNRKKNPAYAKKMESVREKVKAKLAAKKKD